ncbi:MAG: hypothetical protein KJ737_17695 [Proteobacteria bacterium]|nr:hypothetical protein [Pseudomonadota bacterium]
MNKKPTVKLSITSRFFVAADNITKSYNNQLIMEGIGKIDIPKWQNAVKKASDANVGSRYICKKFSGGRRLIDSGITPEVREVDGRYWGGMGPDNAPFLLDLLPPYDGPTCEVLIINGAPLRIAFRTNHTVMDGRGTLTWVDDIFRALRNEPVIGSDPTVSDYHFLNMVSSTPKPASTTYIAPTGKADGDDNGDFIWQRKTIQGTFKKILPQTMLLIAKEAWTYSEGNVGIRVPVDLRPRQKGTKTTNNLSNVFVINVMKGTTVRSLSDLISKRLAEKKDGAFTLEDKITRYMPLKMYETFITRAISRGMKTGLHRSSACVSNLGRLPLDKYTGGGFTPETVFFIPPSLNLFPLFIALTGSGQKVEIVATLPKVLATKGRIESMMENIAEGIQSVSVV